MSPDLGLTGMTIGCEGAGWIGVGVGLDIVAVATVVSVVCDDGEEDGDGARIVVSDALLSTFSSGAGTDRTLLRAITFFSS